MLYSTDASLYQVAPIGVVCPHTPEHAVAAVRFCLERGIPILPRGGGTALAGQTVNTAVIIDFSPHCRRILEIDDSARRARVEPGVVLDQLNGALAPRGLFFGPDVATSSHATLGGMIGNNSSGARSIRYGRTVENLLALRAIGADGHERLFAEGSLDHQPAARAVWDIVDGVRTEIGSRIPKILRHVDGYNLDIMLAQGDLARASGKAPESSLNLAHLLCGSEGTLAVTLEAELALVPKAPHVALGILGFASVRDALAPIQRMLALGPSAVELVDDVILGLARENRECATFLDVVPSLGRQSAGAVMYVEFMETSADDLSARIAALEREFEGTPMQVHRDAPAMARAWRLRKAGEPLLHGLPGHRKPLTFVEDTAVDPRVLPDFVEEFRAIVTRHGTRAAYYAHASVGCLHIRPLVAIEDEADRAILVQIAEEVADLVVRYGGAISGEHGDGRLRSPLLSKVLGEPMCDAIRAIKAVFDPRGLLNPGNLVRTDDPNRIVDHLRVKPLAKDIHSPTVSTFFRFEKEGGFEHATTSCNGAGICRRLMPGGTMCPSYRALLDERHATRGRGNALRLAITGQLSSDGLPSWRDPETQETLSACLSCKACAAECPSNVDIAKLKSEYEAQGFAEQGFVPWRTRLIGHIRRVNRIGSALAPMSDWLRQVPLIRAVIARTLGLDAQRSLPPFGKSVVSWERERARDRERARRRSRGRTTENQCPLALPDDAPTVLLFVDCFTGFSEPAIAVAAIQLLERFGYRVELADVGCCGRTLISTGMLADALQVCGTTAVGLRDAMVRTGARALLVLEPSCASAMRDDWLDLSLSGAHADAVRTVASRTFLVEEFLDTSWDHHPNRPTFSPHRSAVALHAHCHQKALWGAESSSRFLRRILGGECEVLATGCCGMAGAFGARAKTAALSRAIAEGDLLPALSARPNATVCAPGASCRHQVHDLAGRRALHPVEVALAMIDDASWAAECVSARGTIQRA